MGSLGFLPVSDGGLFLHVLLFVLVCAVGAGLSVIIRPLLEGYLDKQVWVQRLIAYQEGKRKVKENNERREKEK